MNYDSRFTFLEIQFGLSFLLLTVFLGFIFLSIHRDIETLIEAHPITVEVVGDG